MFCREKELFELNKRYDNGKFECVIIYGITGGVPHYINKLNVNGDVDEALLDNLFNNASYLFEEPENLLNQELRESAIYNSVISAIAGGASHVNEISTKVGIESAVCAKYLKILLDLGILKKETPDYREGGEENHLQHRGKFL